MYVITDPFCSPSISIGEIQVIFYKFYRKKNRKSAKMYLDMTK